MGSVKDLVTPDNASNPLEDKAAKGYEPPEPHRYGEGAWRVSGRFSVADLKDLIPPIQIADKGEALAMMTAAYFEHAESQGIDSCYVGMIDQDGLITSVSNLVDKGQKSNLIVMKLANTPKSNKPEEVRQYHKAIADGDITVYVADAESIFRAGFPLGSSSFKRIFKLAGRGEAYENLATYDETVAGLDQIRADIAAKGISAFSGLEDYLKTLTLTGVPNPGKILAKPILDFTTKFDIGGDQEITEQQAMQRMGLNPDGYQGWKALVQESAGDQIAYCNTRGITNIDGKLEGVIYKGTPILTDFACTVDENRLMIEHEKDGTVFLVPTNKEIQRAMFRQAGIYVAADQAKERARQKEGNADNWRGYVFEFTTRDTLQQVSETSCQMMADAIRLVANQFLGARVFDAKPLEQWVDAFLPYASRKEN